MKEKKAKKLGLELTDLGREQKKVPSFLGERTETGLDRLLQANLKKMNIELTKSTKKEK
jgi:hypothetical protein